MAQTMNKEARRTIVRTYEGVQWWSGKDYIGRTVFRAAIPGTSMCIERTKNGGIWESWVMFWDDKAKMWLQDPMRWWNEFGTFSYDESTSVRRATEWARERMDIVARTRGEA